MTVKDEDLLRLARDRFTNAVDADKDDRKQADDDIRFAINHEGCQWPSKIRALRENSDPIRPCLVLNKIPEKIDQVEGEFRQLRPSFNVRPVDSKADPQIAEIRAGIIRHIEYNSNARSAYNTSHSSTLYSGRGAWRIDIEDSEEDPFIRDIVINRIPNVFTVYWDPDAKKADKSDAKYFFVTEEIPIEDFKAEHKDIEIKEWDTKDSVWRGWRTDKTIRIAEYWWKEQKDKTYWQVEVPGADGQMTVQTIEAPEDGKLQKDYKRVKDKKKTVKVPQVKWCKMIADRIIEPVEDWPSKYIPIIVEIGKETNIKGKVSTRGMPRFGKEPQRMYNYWSTSNTEFIALIPKIPYLVTSKMIKNYQAQWNQAHKQNYAYLLYDADPTAPTLYPKREDPPQMSTAMATELMRMEHDIMSGMGLYQASLGDEGQEKSGKAILARQRQGSIGSYTYTDNFSTALIYSTKILVDLIPYIYDTERVIRIRGEDDSEKVLPINARPDAPLMSKFQDTNEKLIVQPKKGVSEYINDLTVGKYDVVVTIGPSYTTQREEALTVLMDLVKAIPQIGQVAIDLIVKNLDVPGSAELVERVKKLIPVGIRDLEPGEEPPQEQQDPKLLIEMMGMAIKEREENRKQFEGYVKAIKDLAEAESKEKGQQLAEFQAIATAIQSGLQELQQQKQPTEPGV